jgi:hypothetical protein
MPRFRFTIRRMMFAVVVAAVYLWGERIRRASSAYQERAEFFRYLHTTPSNNPLPSGDSSVAELRIDIGTEIARGCRLIRYCETMQQKYEHASRYPWLPVAPDPPEPN